MSSSNAKSQQAIEAVLTRAAHDRAFRRELLSDPRGAIYRAFGVQIPDDFRIKFIERDADVDALIVLPDLEDNDVLSDDELEAVTGGGANAQQMWAGTLKRRPRRSSSL